MLHFSVHMILFYYLKKYDGVCAINQVDDDDEELLLLSKLASGGTAV